MEKKYDMLISALDAIGYTRETDPVKLKTIARNALKGFRSAQHHAHLTPETQPQSQAVGNASALEQSDGDTPPAQAQVA